MKSDKFQKVHGKTKGRIRSAVKGSANPRDRWPLVFGFDEPEQPNPAPKVVKAAAPRKMKKKFDGIAAIRYRLERMRKTDFIGFKEEFVFSDRRKFRADFVVGESLLIEYDGGTHSSKKGGHTSGNAIARDCEKANLAAALGFKYLRFTVDLLRHPHYFEDIVRATFFVNAPLPERSIKIIQARKK